MLKNVPAGLFSWLVHRSQRAERQQTQALQHAQARAFALFAQQNPSWVASLFDQHFLEHAAAPLLQRYLEPHNRITAFELAVAYCAQFSNTGAEPRRFAEAITVAAHFLALLNHELGSFWPTHPAEQNTRPNMPSALPSPPNFAGDADGLFAAALRDPSNLELDWIWLACQVTRETERRYCLERALYINPGSAVARRMLAENTTV
jgi:hypothetical protein